MIGEPPRYQITCNCGMRISGNNENGLVSLVKLHLESGVYHTAYVYLNKFIPGDSELERTIKEAVSIKEKK